MNWLSKTSPIWGWTLLHINTVNVYIAAQQCVWICLITQSPKKMICAKQINKTDYLLILSDMSSAENSLKKSYKFNLFFLHQRHWFLKNIFVVLKVMPVKCCVRSKQKTGDVPQWAPHVRSTSQQTVINLQKCPSQSQWLTLAPVTALCRWLATGDLQFLSQQRLTLPPEDDQPSLNSPPGEQSFSITFYCVVNEKGNRLVYKWITGSWWCSADRTSQGPPEGDILSKKKELFREQGGKGGVLRMCHRGTQRPHLLWVCMTGSLASHPQNYSRLCDFNSSVFFFFLRGKRGIQAAFQVRRIRPTLWHSYVFVWPRSLLSIERPRKKEKRRKKVCSLDRNFLFFRGFSSLHNVADQWKPCLQNLAEAFI